VNSAALDGVLPVLLPVPADQTLDRDTGRGLAHELIEPYKNGELV
jgi:hypothetical protein